VPDPPPDPQSPAAAQPEHGTTEPDGPPQEEGPLRARRFRKPDGRTLILFERRDDA
jgi:hypothetical protein